MHSFPLSNSLNKQLSPKIKIDMNLIHMHIHCMFVDLEKVYDKLCNVCINRQLKFVECDKSSI